MACRFFTSGCGSVSGRLYRPLPAVARGKTGTAMSAGTGVANPAVPETAVVSATGERTGIQAGPAVFPEETGSAAGGGQ